MNRSEPLMAEATGLSTSPIRGRDGRMQRRKTRYFFVVSFSMQPSRNVRHRCDRQRAAM